MFIYVHYIDASSHIHLSSPKCSWGAFNAPLIPFMAPIGTSYVIPRKKLETGKLQLHCLLTRQRPSREAKYQKAAYPVQMQDANGTRSASVAVRDIHT